MEIAFVDVTAVVAKRIGDVEGEIVAPFLGCHTQQLAILRLREVLFQIGMESRQ